MSETFEKRATQLWKLLDDIDSLDDACKSDDAAFREACYRIQRRRFDIIAEPEIDVLYAAHFPSAPPPHPTA